MKPIKFPEQTVVIAEDQEEYVSLPALVKTNVEGETIFCWGLTLWERIYLLFTGRLWVSVWRFRNEKGIINPLQPLRGSVFKSDIIAPNNLGYVVGDYVKSNGKFEAVDNELRIGIYRVLDITPAGPEAGGAHVWLDVRGEKKGFYANGLIRGDK